MGSKLYDESMKLSLEQNAVEMYSTNNEGKFVIVDRLIRTLKNKIYKYMTSISDFSLKLVILLEYQNKTAFLQNSFFQIVMNKFSWLKKLERLRRGHILLVILKVKKLLKRFTKKDCEIMEYFPEPKSN